MADPVEVNTVIKSTQFPGKMHEKIDLMFKGRSIPIKGQVKYTQTWTATFYLSEDHKLKNAFEIWLEALDQKHNYSTDVNGLSYTQAIHQVNGYTSTIRLYQKDFNGDQPTSVYTLYNVFPIEISTLDYSADNVGQVQEFTVTFAFSNYTMSVEKSIVGSFVDEQIEKVKVAAQEAADQLVGSTGSLISGIIPSSLESHSNENKQVIQTVDDMNHSIFDAIGSNKWRS